MTWPQVGHWVYPMAHEGQMVMVNVDTYKCPKCSALVLAPVFHFAWHAGINDPMDEWDDPRVGEVDES